MSVTQNQLSGTLCNKFVKPKSLSRTNPYLKDKAAARKALIINVATSTVVETGQPVDELVEYLLKKEELKCKK